VNAYGAHFTASPRHSIDLKQFCAQRAGSARVIVPVQPMYDEAVLYYLATNQIWNGGTPPALDDPLYRSLIAELKADAGANLDDVPACSVDGTTYPCLVDEWDIKLPTDLVYLQQDATLPQLRNWWFYVTIGAVPYRPVTSPRGLHSSGEC
jgi:hypothetical protein